MPQVRAAIAAHRDSWITEADFAMMADNGINAVRLPVGYWALAETAAQASPFVEQAYKYIDLAMEWGLSHGATHEFVVLYGIHVGFAKGVRTT
jgi:glucan 1,3-beta-glucosidase